MAIEPADLRAPAPGRARGPSTGEGAVVLEVRHLRKRYGAIEAVKDVSFQIAAGETYGLLGPNGAGKTTTISMVCGLLARDAGEVTLDGQPIDVGAVAAKAGIGYVPQELAIYPDLSGRENLAFTARLGGIRGAEADSRIDAALRRVRLTEVADRRVGTFSRGMRQRLGLAEVVMKFFSKSAPAAFSSKPSALMLVSWRAARAMLVLMPPGWTLIARTLVALSSWRSASVKPRTANLAAL